MSRVLKRSSILLGSILITILAVEFGLRIHSIYSGGRSESVEELLERSKNSPPPVDVGTANLRGLVQKTCYEDLTYELKPNLQATFRESSLRLNSLGMRGSEVSIRKADDTLRIVGLGDSVMFGWGVEEEDGFLSHLVGLLEERYPQRRFEVLNFAVPGYNTFLEVEAFEKKALQFDPDLVIIQFVNNDLDLPRFMEEPRTLWGWDYSILLDRLTRNGSREPSDSDLTDLFHKRKVTTDQKDRLREQFHHMTGEEGFRTALQKLAELTRAGEIPVLCMIPAENGDPWSLMRSHATENGFNYCLTDPYINNYLREKSGGVSLEALKETIWISPSDPHPNEDGHALFALALLDSIIENDLLGLE